jgi:hypothetical protein
MGQTVNGAIGASFVGKVLIPLALGFGWVSWSGDQTSLVYSALAGIDAALLAYGVHLRRTLD